MKLFCFLAQSDAKKINFLKLAISWNYATKADALPKRLEVCASCLFILIYINHRIKTNSKILLEIFNFS